MKTPLFFAAAATVLVVALSGCTPTSAGDSAGGSKAPKQAVPALDWGVHYAKCMRDKGNEFPDPTEDGAGRGIQAARDKSPEEFHADLESCTESVTTKYGKRPVTEKDRNAVADDDQTNDCLRKNGVDVPDQSGDSAGATQTGDVPKSVLDECGLDDEAAR